MEFPLEFRSTTSSYGNGVRMEMVAKRGGPGKGWDTHTQASFLTHHLDPIQGNQGLCPLLPSLLTTLFYLDFCSCF